MCNWFFYEIINAFLIKTGLFNVLKGFGKVFPLRLPFILCSGAVRTLFRDRGPQLLWFEIHPPLDLAQAVPPIGGSHQGLSAVMYWGRPCPGRQVGLLCWPSLAPGLPPLFCQTFLRLHSSLRCVHSFCLSISYSCKLDLYAVWQLSQPFPSPSPHPFLFTQAFSSNRILAFLILSW